MAAGTLSDFKIYDELFHTSMTETLQQNADVFNAASRGSIQQVVRRLMGEYEKSSFFKSISGLVADRDVTSTAAVTSDKLTADEQIGVKRNKRIGPIENTIDSFKKVAKDPKEFSLKLGEQWAKAVAVEYTNNAVAAAKAAITNAASGALIYDATGETVGTLTHEYMVRGLAKMGDAADRVVCWVMHSKPFFDLMERQITQNIFQATNLTIYEASVATLGRPVIVTDSSALIDTVPTPDVYFVLGLQEGAVEVAESEERTIFADILPGKENLTMILQGEFAYNLKVKGAKWDTANGGSNPTFTEIATSTNWDQVATDSKDCAGIIVKVE